MYFDLVPVLVTRSSLTIQKNHWTFSETLHLLVPISYNSIGVTDSAGTNNQSHNHNVTRGMELRGFFEDEDNSLTFKGHFSPVI
jgi:hypothetical protein